MKYCYLQPYVAPTPATKSNPSAFGGHLKNKSINILVIITIDMLLVKIIGFS